MPMMELTKFHRTEEKVEVNEEMFSLENTHDAFCLYTRQGAIFSFAFDYRKKELLHKDSGKLIPTYFSLTMWFQASRSSPSHDKLSVYL
jgi:hypothetical protein